MYIHRSFWKTRLAVAFRFSVCRQNVVVRKFRKWSLYATSEKDEIDSLRTICISNPLTTLRTSDFPTIEIQFRPDLAVDDKYQNLQCLLPTLLEGPRLCWRCSRQSTAKRPNEPEGSDICRIILGGWRLVTRYCYRKEFLSKKRSCCD